MNLGWKSEKKHLIFRAIIGYPILNDEKPAYVSTDKHTATLMEGIIWVGNCWQDFDSLWWTWWLSWILSSLTHASLPSWVSCCEHDLLLWTFVLAIYPTIKMRCEKGYFYYRQMPCKILCFRSKQKRLFLMEKMISSREIIDMFLFLLVLILP